MSEAGGQRLRGISQETYEVASTSSFRKRGLPFNLPCSFSYESPKGQACKSVGNQRKNQKDRHVAGEWKWGSIKNSSCQPSAKRTGISFRQSAKTDTGAIDEKVQGFVDCIGLQACPFRFLFRFFPQGNGRPLMNVGKVECAVTCNESVFMYTW